MSYFVIHFETPVKINQSTFDISNEYLQETMVFLSIFNREDSIPLH